MATPSTSPSNRVRAASARKPSIRASQSGVASRQGVAEASSAACPAARTVCRRGPCAAVSRYSTSGGRQKSAAAGSGARAAGQGCDDRWAGCMPATLMVLGCARPNTGFTTVTYACLHVREPRPPGLQRGRRPAVRRTFRPGCAFSIGARAQRRAGRTAVGRGCDGAKHGGCQPGQVAPGPHHLVLRTVRAGGRARRLRADRPAVGLSVQQLLPERGAYACASAPRAGVTARPCAGAGLPPAGRCAHARCLAGGRAGSGAGAGAATGNPA